MKKLSIIFMPALLSACGIGAGYFSEQIRIASDQSSYNYDRVSIQATETPNDIKQKIGAPSKIEQQGDEVWWIYNREFGFSGPVIQILIPIPLVVPVGYRHTTFVFEGDKLTKVISEYAQYNGFLCGIQNAADGGFRCAQRTEL